MPTRTTLAPDRVTSFDGPYRFLSNFYACRQLHLGFPYPTAEHAYQAAKAVDVAEFHRIATAATPGLAKRLGRRCAVRADWDTVKIDVMREILRQKFTSPALRAKLLATDDAELIEGNTWGDRFWGVCDGRGQNWLGQLLMQLRAQLREAPPMPIIRVPCYTREEIRAHPDRLYVFGDNLAERGGEPDRLGRSNPRAGQAAACRGEPNAVGIPTKRLPSMRAEAFLTDADFDDVRPIIVERFRRLAAHLAAGGVVVLPEDGIGSGRAQLSERAPQIAAFLSRCFAHLEAPGGPRT